MTDTTSTISLQDTIAREVKDESKAVAPSGEAGFDLPHIAGPISIVVPLFNEEGNVRALHEWLTFELQSLDEQYEIVLIDDGSLDGTWRAITEIRESDRHVVALRHRRNFGKAQALANGFAVARGDLVITMDGDLQDDPAEIGRMIDALNEGFDLVSGWKQNRQDSRDKTAPSRLFNWTVRKVTGVELHDFNCGFKIYRREVTDTIRLYGELHRFTPVLAAAEGFRVSEITVKHHPRTWGESKYGFKRLFKGFLDLVTVFFLTNYRQRPMHLFGLPGMLAIGIGVLIGLKLTFDRLVSDQEIGTRPLLLLAVLLIVVGTQFFGLGLLGEFMAHGSNRRTPDPKRYLRSWLGVEFESETINRDGPSESPTPPASS